MNLLVFGNTSKDAAWQPVQQALCRQELCRLIALEEGLLRG